MPTKTEISEFSLFIEELAEKLNCSRMDAIIEHCNETDLEVDVVSTLISPSLKSKLIEEAQELHLLKKSSKLPI